MASAPLQSVASVKIQQNMLSTITRRQILDPSKLKDFADDNFEFDEHGRKLSRQVENNKLKRRNCSLRAISPFPTVFQKAYFPGGVKKCHCVGMFYTQLVPLNISAVCHLH